MKKLFTTLLLGASLLLLTACQHPDGMNEQFYHSAVSVFSEIDDDTSEMELPDKDDILNFEMVASQAVTTRENQFVENMQVIIAQNPKVIEGDREALKTYLKARSNIGAILEVQLYQFSFTEE